MKANTIIESLKNKIQEFSVATDSVEIGTVISVADGIARVSGLHGCQASEMLVFPDGAYGLAINLEEDVVGVIMLGDSLHIKEGDTVERTGQILSVPVGEVYLGRVLDPLMRPIDGKDLAVPTTTLPVERIAPGVMTRKSVSVPLQTGIKAIDALVPVGRGQRELIIGDRQTGKTAIAIDAILNQKGQDVICIYVAIGQKKSKVMRIVTELQQKGAMEYTAVVLAGASDSAALQYIAP